MGCGRAVGVLREGQRVVERLRVECLRLFGGPLSGDYRGHAEVLGFFQRFMQMSGGTFRVEIQDLLANERRVLVLVTESAERNGRKWSSPQVHAWTIENGKATVFWQFQGDQRSEDEFWS